MKILLGWKECPSPPDRSGSRRRAAALLDALARGGHDVDLVHFADPGDSGGILRNTGRRRRMQDVLAPGAPLFRPYYEHAEMRARIRSFRGDAAILGQDQMAIYRDAVRGIPCLLDATDAWTLVLDSLIASERSWWRRAYLRSHRRRIESHIREHYHRFDAVLAVSERDAAALRRVDPRIRTRVLPHCIDTDRFGEGREAAVPTVIYAGVLGHAPNADGAVRLAREIWPRVRGSVAGARLRIVGRDPRPDVRALACADVEVTGAVPSIAAELASAWVAVCPMWSGAGMKTKVLEAMAAAKPVVSTREGVAGMPGAEEAGVRVSDEPPRFAEELIRFLGSRDLRRETGLRLRTHVRERYSWDRARAVLDAILEERMSVTA